jgi:hypothetical protein
MKFIVVEKKKTGWVEIIECSEERDASAMVEELYRESKTRKENREFKYISLPGIVELPPEKPNTKIKEKINEKISNILKL